MIDAKNLSNEEKIELAEIFLTNGMANKKKITEANVDPEQLKMGIEVEAEHSGNASPLARKIAERIALDHLAEIKDYYTRLHEMEKAAKNKENEIIDTYADSIKLKMSDE